MSIDFSSFYKLQNLKISNSLELEKILRVNRLKQMDKNLIQKLMQLRLVFFLGNLFHSQICTLIVHKSCDTLMSK